MIGPGEVNVPQGRRARALGEASRKGGGGGGERLPLDMAE